MPTQIDTDGTTVRTLAEITQVDVDGATMRHLKELWQNDAAGVPKLIFTGFKVTIAPDPVTGYISTPGTHYAVTGGCFATITGGTAPYLCAWTASAGWSPNSPTLSGTSFISPPLANGDSADGDAYLTVTDANSQVAVSNDITLFASNS